VIDLGRHDRPRPQRSDGRHRDLLDVQADGPLPGDDAGWQPSPIADRWTEESHQRPPHDQPQQYQSHDDQQHEFQPHEFQPYEYQPHEHQQDEQPPGQWQYAQADSAPDPYDWPKGDPLTDPWVDRS
jgi:hypothetical protein